MTRRYIYRPILKDRNSLTSGKSGTLHTICAVAGGVMTLYVDGVSRGTSPAARVNGNASARRVTAASNAGDPFGQWFSGSVAGVAVYDTTLSDARIAAHYAAGI